MKIRPKFPLVVALLTCVSIAWVGTAVATTVMHRNIVDLIDLSDRILAGTITEVTDGFDSNGVPYTEVTMALTETIRGGEKGSYTFRQFGLLEPRDMGNGVTNLNTTLDGWPTYAQGQEVVLFLYKESPMAGLRTTVGLLQGKFVINGENLGNAIDNKGLFNNLTVDQQYLTQQDAKMLETEKGPVNRETFMSFLRKVVDEQWIEQGRLSSDY